MNSRSHLKSAFILLLLLALQGAGLAAAIPYHADHAAQGTMSDCNKSQGNNAPADSGDQKSAPCCCDALGLCQAPSATIAALTAHSLAVREFVFPSFEEAFAERESPPDPFPPRS